MTSNATRTQLHDRPRSRGTTHPLSRGTPSRLALIEKDGCFGGGQGRSTTSTLSQRCCGCTAFRLSFNPCGTGRGCEHPAMAPPRTLDLNLDLNLNQTSKQVFLTQRKFFFQWQCASVQDFERKPKCICRFGLSYCSLPSGCTGARSHRTWVF